MKGVRVQPIALYALMATLGAVSMFPFLVMVGAPWSSTATGLSDAGNWIPLHPTASNYRTVLGQSLALRWLLNSTVMTVVPMVTTTVICCAVGFVFAKKRFRGKEILFWVFMAVLMVPP